MTRSACFFGIWFDNNYESEVSYSVSLLGFSKANPHLKVHLWSCGLMGMYKSFLEASCYSENLVASGPGCSSMTGMAWQMNANIKDILFFCSLGALWEIGPCRFTQLGQYPTPFPNYAWNNIANVIFLDQRE
jgi:hypothetical protein